MSKRTGAKADLEHIQGKNDHARQHKRKLRGRPHKAKRIARCLLLATVDGEAKAKQNKAFLKQLKKERRR